MMMGQKFIPPPPNSTRIAFFIVLLLVLLAGGAWLMTQSQNMPQQITQKQVQPEQAQAEQAQPEQTQPEQAQAEQTQQKKDVVMATPLMSMRYVRLDWLGDCLRDGRMSLLYGTGRLDIARLAPCFREAEKIPSLQSMNDKIKEAMNAPPLTRDALMRHDDNARSLTQETAPDNSFFGLVQIIPLDEMESPNWEASVDNVSQEERLLYEHWLFLLNDLIDIVRALQYDALQEASR